MTRGHRRRCLDLCARSRGGAGERGVATVLAVLGPPPDAAQARRRPAIPRIAADRHRPAPRMAGRRPRRRSRRPAPALARWRKRGRRGYRAPQHAGAGRDGASPTLGRSPATPVSPPGGRRCGTSRCRRISVGVRASWSRAPISRGRCWWRRRPGSPRRPQRPTTCRQAPLVVHNGRRSGPARGSARSRRPSPSRPGGSGMKARPRGARRRGGAAGLAVGCGRRRSRTERCQGRSAAHADGRSTFRGSVACDLAARPVFVSAARYEPFGLAVLEAAQAGCALVLVRYARVPRAVGRRRGVRRRRDDVAASPRASTALASDRNGAPRSASRRGNGPAATDLDRQVEGNARRLRQGARRGRKGAAA